MKSYNNKQQFFLLILLVTLITSFQPATARIEKAERQASALKGKSYFPSGESLGDVMKSRKTRAAYGECIVDSESDCSGGSCRIESTTSTSNTESSCSESSSSSNCSESSATSESTCSESSSSSSGFLIPCLRRSRITRVNYQVPWCPGQVMATLVPKAMDAIYDWRLPETCQQFADNFGGVSVLVGELGAQDFCSAGPSPWIYSNYTITRGLSVNEAIYARVLDQGTGVEYAAAAGPILYPNGLVMYISVSKEASKLPQVCRNQNY